MPFRSNEYNHKAKLSCFRVLVYIGLTSLDGYKPKALGTLYRADEKRDNVDHSGGVWLNGSRGREPRTGEGTSSVMAKRAKSVAEYILTPSRPNSSLNPPIQLSIHALGYQQPSFREILGSDDPSGSEKVA